MIKACVRDFVRLCLALGTQAPKLLSFQGPYQMALLQTNPTKHCFSKAIVPANKGAAEEA
jgi:hypothetical protein